MKSLSELKEQLVQAPRKKRVGLVAAQDEHALDAVLLAMRDGLVEPVLVGDEVKIKALLKEFDCSAAAVEIEHIPDAEACALRAAELVRRNELDCIMKGKIETGQLMKVLVNRETGIRDSDTMNFISLLEAPGYHKLFAVTDCGLLVYPDVNQKRDMIKNTVKAMHKLGIGEPKVAVLAAIEHLNSKMKETVDAAELKKLWQNGEINGCVLEGPISYDLAMSKEAARIKEYESPVAGDADLLAVPDICSGNMVCKSLLYTGGARLAGTILGAQVPLIFTSRSSSMEDKYYSILLNALIGKVA